MKENKRLNDFLALTIVALMTGLALNTLFALWNMVLVSGFSYPLQIQKLTANAGIGNIVNVDVIRANGTVEKVK